MLAVSFAGHRAPAPKFTIERNDDYAAAGIDVLSFSRERCPAAEHVHRKEERTMGHGRQRVSVTRKRVTVVSADRSRALLDVCIYRCWVRVSPGGLEAAAPFNL